MSKLVQGFIKELPPYTDLIKTDEHIVETPEKSKLRLIEKINNYNGGVK